MLGAQPAHGRFRLFDRLELGKVDLGLGLGYLSEQQKSLTFDSATGTVTVLDLDLGTTQTSPRNEDPRLLNRKFDLEWSMDGPGVQVPFTLQSSGWAQLRSSLTLRVMEGDFDLRFHDRQEPELSDSLRGNGTVLVTEVGLEGGLCRACPWFMASGYRFESLPDVEAERNRPFSSPGQRVLSDENRLSRQTHDAFAVFGYKYAGDRFRSYVGVGSRWSEIEIEDELRLFDPSFNQETTLRSHTRLDSRTTDAIAGFEARISDAFVHRTEVIFNDEDYGVFTGVSYRISRPRGKLDELSAKVAPGLQRVASDFYRGWSQLDDAAGPDGSPEYWASQVKVLLEDTENAFIAILDPYEEFSALEDAVRDDFDEARRWLGLLSGPQRSFMANGRVGVAKARFQSRGSGATLERDKVVQVFGALDSSIIEPLKSGGPYSTKLTFRMEPKTRATYSRELEIYSRFNPSANHHTLAAGSTNRDVAWGAYSFKVYPPSKGPDDRACDAATFKPKDAPCPLRLVGRSSWLLICRQGGGCELQ